MVFVSFGGLTKVAAIAEEVRRPGRNIPGGMIAAATVVTLLYVLAALVMVGVLDGKTLAGDLKPMATAGGQLFGLAGVVLVSAGAMLAFITTANGGILAASRSPLAMSRDGLLPGALARALMIESRRAVRTESSGIPGVGIQLKLLGTFPVTFCICPTVISVALIQKSSTFTVWTGTSSPP